MRISIKPEKQNQISIMIKICLIAAFPPSIRPLNEYSFNLAREFQRHEDVELTILADELEDYNFATDAKGNPADAQQSSQCRRVRQSDAGNSAVSRTPYGC